MSKSFINIVILSSILSLSIASCLCFAKENKPLLIIFTAQWCDYCKKIEKILEENKKINDLLKNYDVVYVDYDKSPEMIRGYNINIVPTFIVYSEGKELKRQIGYKDGWQGFIKFLSK